MNKTPVCEYSYGQKLTVNQTTSPSLPVFIKNKKIGSCMCTEFYHINIHLNRKTTTYLILSKKQRFIWVALAVKPHLINWISVFHSIVKSDHLGKEKSFCPESCFSNGRPTQLDTSKQRFCSC